MSCSSRIRTARHGLIGALALGAAAAAVPVAAAPASANPCQPPQICQIATTKAASQTASNLFGDHDSTESTISADGRYVAFTSSATNLSAVDDDTDTDVYRKDLSTGAVVLVSQANSVAATGNSKKPTISSDGRYIAFESTADNLVANDTNNVADVFRKDLATGTVVRVSTDANGGQSSVASGWPSINSDGRYVAYHAGAVPLRVYRKDLATGERLHASVSPVGSTACCGVIGSGGASISADGRYVAFATDGLGGLFGWGPEGPYRGFVRKDLATGESGPLVIANTDANGSVAEDSSAFLGAPKLSANGRYVAFVSKADALVPNDDNGVADTFRKDLDTGAIVRADTDAAGQAIKGGVAPTGSVAISADGRYVAMVAKVWVPNQADHILRKDLASGQNGPIVVIDTSTNGQLAAGQSSEPAISGNGSFVSFTSTASNLAGGDAANKDVFRKLG